MNKLEQWVQGLVDRGALRKKVGFPISKIVIEDDEDGEPYIWLYSMLGDRRGFSLQEILLNTEAMKAGYNSGDVCSKTRCIFYKNSTDNNCDMYADLARCGVCPESKWSRIALHAVSLILRDKQEEALDYLIKELV